MQLPSVNRTTVRDFIHVLFKWKQLVVVFFIATVFTVALGTFTTQPTYETTSQILVKVGRENVYSPVLSQGGSPVISLNRQEELNSKIAILTSPYLLEMVVTAIGPAVIYNDIDSNGGILQWFLPKANSANAAPRPPDITDAPGTPVDIAVEKLKKNLSVTNVANSSVIEIAFRHPDPTMAAVVLNKLVDFFMDRHVEIHKTGESNVFFKEQSEILHAKIQASEDVLQALKKEHKVNAVGEERSLLLGKSADLHVALNTTESDIAETDKRLAYLKSQAAQTPLNIVQSEETGINSVVISTLENHLVLLELKEKELLMQYTPQSRFVTNVRDEIETVHRKLTEQDDKQYGRRVSGLNPIHQTLQEALLTNQAQLNALEAKKIEQQRQLSEYSNKLETLNQVEVAFSDLEERLVVDRQNYRLYLGKYEESRISNAMDSMKITNVSRIQPAMKPFKPVAPNKRLNLILALLIGGIGSFGLAFFMEYLDPGMDKPENVERILELPVLASISETSKR